MKLKLIFLSLFFYSFMMATAHSGFMEVAKVSKVHGMASLNKEKVKVGAEIAEGMEIVIPKPGDYIEVTFQNGHIVRFMGARAYIENLNPKTTLINLIRGKIFSAVKSLTTDESFMIKTKRASFSVRGTRFFIDESAKSSYLCVCHGIVSAKSFKGEVEVKEEEDLTLLTKKSDLNVTVASKDMMEMGNRTFKNMKAF